MSSASFTALVTHACDFAGPAAVQSLLKDGFWVIAQDPTFADPQMQTQFASEHPGAILTHLTEPDALMELVKQQQRPLQAIVSNDSFPAIHTPIAQAAPEDLRVTLENLMVYPFRLSQAAIPVLKAQGFGNLVFITSCRTLLPLQGGAIPDMARAGANAFVKSLSIELAPWGIAVNAIAPNYYYSEAYFPRAKFIDNPVGQAFIKEVVPVGRLGSVEEMQALVHYLTTLRGNFHTGTIIPFAGGWPIAPKRPF